MKKLTLQLDDLQVGELPDGRWRGSPRYGAWQFLLLQQPDRLHVRLRVRDGGGELQRNVPQLRRQLRRELLRLVRCHLRLVQPHLRLVRRLVLRIGLRLHRPVVGVRRGRLPLMHRGRG